MAPASRNGHGRATPRAAAERGQGSVEWVALVLLVSLALAAIVAVAAPGVPGADLARDVAAKLICAARLAGTCEARADELALEYGAEVAALLREHAPTIHYGAGAAQLPVDHRVCREPGCAETHAADDAWRSADGRRATAFTRVIDCRPSPPPGDADCSGERAGRLYLQYWLYYPDSRTEPWGDRGYHPDDWESLQVRIDEGVEARASSHHSYNHRGGVRNWPSDTGVVPKSGWGPYAGQLHVGSGSHAGHVRGDGPGHRTVPSRRLRLVPIEPLGAQAGPRHAFAVTPPWLKEVYRDPEATGT